MSQCMERHMTANEGRVNLRDWTCRSTLDIIGVTGMDHDFEALQNPDNELYKAFNIALAPPPHGFRYFAALGGFIPPWLLQMVPLPRNKRVKENGDIIRKVAKEMLQQKKAKGLTENDRDIISVAMGGGHFTEENLADQMMTFLAAGHETTAVSLQWFVWAMCEHQDIQVRLREEIRAHLPSISGVNPVIPDAAMVDSLPYLNAVVSEVLRCFPPAAITTRVAQDDTTILDTFVPKGTVAVVSAEAVNHDPKLWGPDAAKFNPDRWMAPGCANSGGASNNYAMMSFIHGPRACIGQGFVKAEMPCIAAVLAGRFKMEFQDPDQGLAYDVGVTVFPKNGLDAIFGVVPGW
jgi:cytochrome P450